VSVIEKGRRGGVQPLRAPRRRRRWPIVALALLAAAALAALWWTHTPERVLEPAPAAEEAPPFEPAPLGAAEPAPAPPPSAAAEPAPPPAEPLPALTESDPLARKLAAGVSSAPLLAAALKEAGVIDRFVAAVDQLAEGQAPRRDLDSLRPTGRFLVLGREPELRLDPASYHRYDALAKAMASVDAKAAAAAYRRLAPLCEESYRALGYPEGGFEQRLRAALALLVATPRSDDSPALVAQVKRYEFADPHLESLADAQKQLLRMGPANAKLVTDKLREIEAAL
jgi:hypothetical protein